MQEKSPFKIVSQFKVVSSWLYTYHLACSRYTI